MNESTFAGQYLATWTEPDPVRRRARLEEVWAPDGRMVVSSTGTTLHGIDEIDRHVAMVHDQNIAGRGLTFRYDQTSVAGDAVLLRSAVALPDGTVATRGVDVIFQDPAGRVTTAYMFMGID